MSKMTGTVLKEMETRNKVKEERMNSYLKDKC